ncbi:MAG TPA: hypothetical protein VG943_00170 [Caulobacterales bacterium]|nr:hypothetical protein [Caulobacterales bacterium]
MSDEEKIEWRVGAEGRSCTLIKMEPVGAQGWRATVRCPDGSTKSAEAANQNEAKVLACMECE